MAYIRLIQQRKRKRPGRDKLVGVEITGWERPEWGVVEHYRAEGGDWYHGWALSQDKKPPAASIKRRRKVPA